MEKINVAELLEDCPKGMELDCAVFDNIIFNGSISNCVYPIKVITKDGSKSLNLTKYGCTSENKNAKCIIFPKGKTTWEGFHRPFKDGDVVAYDNPHRANLQVFIFKDKKENDILSFCYLMLDGDELDLEEGMYYVTRLATEEEKERLFNAIEAKGYKWNPERKTLEELPKFKDGDIIYTKTKVNGNWLSIYKELEGCNLRTYVDISLNNNLHFYYNRLSNSTLCCKEEISEQRLATEEEKEKLFQVIRDNGFSWNSKTKTLDVLPRFKVGDKVRHKDDKTVIIITGIKDDYYLIQFYNIRKHDYQNEKVSFKDQDNYYKLIPNKFDINTLVPFESKVLVRNSGSGFWKPAFWGTYEAERSNEHQYRNYLTTDGFFRHCIPYNDETKHLVGKTCDCPEYYKTWED